MEDDSNKLLYSLHEQFAENQNHHQGLFIQLLVSLLVLFGGFGYVFVHTTEDVPLTQTWVKDDYFSYTIFLLVSFVVLLVLLLLNLIVIHLGYSFRRDQYLNMKIRRDILGLKYKDIFGKLYDPSNKGVLNYLPNFYAIFFWAITILQIIIFVATYIKLIIDYNYCICILISIATYILTIICFLFHPILLLISILNLATLYYNYNSIILVSIFTPSIVSILLSFFCYYNTYYKYKENLEQNSKKGT